MARRSKLTPETQQAIINALNSGNWLETAAHYAGIASATLYNWLDRGRIERERIDADEEPYESESAYVEFLEAVEKARSQAQVRAVGLIQKAAIDGTWQAAAWFLERSDPQRWGRYGRVEVTGANGGAVAVDVTSLEEKVKKVIGRSQGEGVK
jgi:transposase-like protein